MPASYYVWTINTTIILLEVSWRHKCQNDNDIFQWHLSMKVSWHNQVNYNVFFQTFKKPWEWHTPQISKCETNYIGHRNASLSIFVDSIQIFAVKDGVEQSCSFSVELVFNGSIATHTKLKRNQLKFTGSYVSKSISEACFDWTVVKNKPTNGQLTYLPVSTHFAQ